MLPVTHPSVVPQNDTRQQHLPASLRSDEAARLKALRACAILDTEDEQFFDDVVFLAKNICGASIAVVSLVDEHRQWFKARMGIDDHETSREVSFCAHAILGSDRVFEVEDALADSRFAQNPLVLGDPHIRFYAGAPIVISGWAPVGTVCVIDCKPGKLNPQQAELLTSLARKVGQELEQRAATAMRDSATAAV